MKIGTKSVLFGAHQFLIHPWFVAWAWWKLFGFPFDPRLWVAFFVHDLGYIGKPNMDGAEGETHVELGALLMHRLFDWPRKTRESPCRYCGRVWNGQGGSFWGPACSAKDGCGTPCNTRWYDFCVYHSRFYAKRDSQPFSRLCVADKLAICLTPAWLYLPMARATGEIQEYMKLAAAIHGGAGGGKYATMNLSTDDQRKWYADVQAYLTRWVAEHKDMRPDTWTPAAKAATTESGVWK